MKQETEVKDNAAVLADDERRAQEAKQEKLRNAESIDMAAAAGNGAGKGASEEGGLPGTDVHANLSAHTSLLRISQRSRVGWEHSLPS
jgi:hypothetical protein